MTGTTRSSADLDPRRKRILFHAWHRGTREMDLILGRFVDSTVGEWSDSEVSEMEAVLRVPDVELFRWITGQADVPAPHDSAMMTRIIAFHGGARG